MVPDTARKTNEIIDIVVVVVIINQPVINAATTYFFLKIIFALGQSGPHFEGRVISPPIGIKHTAGDDMGASNSNQEMVDDLDDSQLVDSSG